MLQPLQQLHKTHFTFPCWLGADLSIICDIVLRAVTNLGLCSWPSAPKLNGPSHASWLLIFPLSLPHKQLSFFPPMDTLPQPLLISRVLISSDCQNILAMAALNFLAPLEAGVCGLGLSISSLVQEPHEVSLCHHERQHSRKHLLCQTRSWSGFPSQPKDGKEKEAF